MKYLLFVLLLMAVLITAGCVSESNSAVVTPAHTTSITPTVNVTMTTTVKSPVISTPNQNATPSLVITKTPSPVVVSTIATPLPQPTKLGLANDPLVEELNLHTDNNRISDCIMRQEFPDIAKDPNYGIKSDPPKLVGISTERWNAFYYNVIQGKNPDQSQSISVDRCAKFPYSEDTTWDFLSFRAILYPRNSIPSEYSIIVSINANGKTVAQIITNETLTIDQPVTIQSWIPIKRSEVDAIGPPEIIYFNRVTNN